MLLSVSILDGRAVKKQLGNNLDELSRVPLLLQRLQDRNPAWGTVVQQVSEEPVRGPRLQHRRNAIVTVEDIRRMFDATNLRNSNQNDSSENSY